MTPPPAATFLDSVWESIITPGAGPGLVATINGSLLVLLGVCAYFGASGLIAGHLAVLAALALGLLLSFNWFLSQVEAAKEATRRKAAAAGMGGADVGAAPPAAVDDGSVGGGVRRRQL